MLLSNQSITGWLFPRKRSFSWNKREKANFHSEWPLRVLLYSSCSWPHWWDESSKIPPIQSRFLFHVSKLLTWCLSGHFVCWHFDEHWAAVDTITTVYEARPMQNWSSFFPAWSCVWVCKYCVYPLMVSYFTTFVLYQMVLESRVLFYDRRFLLQCHLKCFRTCQCQRGSIYLSLSPIPQWIGWKFQFEMPV